MSIPHALLALLAAEPTFGLRLKEDFEANTGTVWPLNVGQVYTTLGRLERDGLVAAAGPSEQPAQRRYQLTEAGRTELMTWFESGPPGDVPPRDEVVIKVMVALTVPGIDVTRVIDRQRTKVLETMRSYTALKRSAGADDLALLLTADAEVLRLEAMHRWLDSAAARLAAGAALPRRQPPRPPRATRAASAEAPDRAAAAAERT